MKYLLKKIYFNLYKGTLISKIYSLIIFPYFKGFYHIFFFKKNQRIKLEINFNKKSASDSEICKRIFNSFKKMKADQKKSFFTKPSKEWQNQLKISYRELNESFKENNSKKFQLFLNNFGVHDRYLGIENQVFLKEYSKNIFLKNYLKNTVFTNQMKLWNFHNSGKKSSKSLRTPKFGNQVGAKIDNNFVTLSSFSNEIISSNLEELLNFNNKKLRVVELGGGYGQFAYHLLKKRKNFLYIDFDIPEVLCLASYYLIKTFPQKKTLLYGEKNFSIKKSKNYNFIFLPYFEISKLKKNSVDLFINMCSLSEMEKTSVHQYFKYINNASKYIFHMNHDINRNKFSKNKTSYLAHEYPISKKFILKSKYLDIFHFMNFNGNIDFDKDIFAYLYENSK